MSVIIADLIARFGVEMPGWDKLTQQMEMVRAAGIKAAEVLEKGGSQKGAKATLEYAQSLELLRNKFDSFVKKSAENGASKEQLASYFEKFQKEVLATTGHLPKLTEALAKVGGSAGSQGVQDVTAHLRALDVIVSKYNPSQIGKFFSSIAPEASTIKSLRDANEQWTLLLGKLTAVEQLKGRIASSGGASANSTAVALNSLTNDAVANQLQAIRSNVLGFGSSGQNLSKLAADVNMGVKSLVDGSISSFLKAINSARSSGAADSSAIYNVASLSTELSSQIGGLFKSVAERQITQLKAISVNQTLSGDPLQTLKNISSVVDAQINKQLRSFQTFGTSADNSSTNKAISDKINTLINDSANKVLDALNKSAAVNNSNSSGAATEAAKKISDQISQASLKAITNTVDQLKKELTSSSKSNSQVSAVATELNTKASTTIAGFVRQDVERSLQALSTSLKPLDSATMDALSARVSSATLRILQSAISANGGAAQSRTASMNTLLDTQQRATAETIKHAAVTDADTASIRKQTEALNANVQATERSGNSKRGRGGSPAGSELDGVSRAANEAAQSASRAAASSQNWASTLQTLGAFAGVASGPLGHLLGQMAAFGYLGNTVSLSTALMVAGGARAISMFTGFVSEMVRVERIIGPVRQLHMELAKVIGGDGAEAYKQITDTMVKYGWALDALSKPIARLKLAVVDTVLGGENFKGFIESFASISGRFALPTESISGMAKAFEQMISKGTVQAEEFRQQLGDRLPAAARIGLETFRVMTGNASASFTQFMDAMKNRQIESTRFLDIFMLKAREMFNISTEAPQGIASAYGRLSAAHDLAVNKIDNAIGVTRAWAKTLNNVAEIWTIIGNNAQTAVGIFTSGMALLAARTAIVVGGLTGIGAVITSWLGPITLASVGLLALKTGFVGLQVVAAGYATGELINGITTLYKSVTNLLWPVDQLKQKLAGIKFTSGTNFDPIENIRKALESGAALKSEAFQIHADVVDKDGNRLFSDPKVLIAEASRYFSHVDSALRSGKLLKADFDFVSSFDIAIAKLQQKIDGTGSILTPILKKDGTESGKFFRKYEDDLRNSVSLAEAMDSRLSKANAEALNKRTLHIEDAFERASLASQQMSLKESTRQIKSHQEEISRMEILKQRFIDTRTAMANYAEQANKSVDLTLFERFKKILSDNDTAARALGITLGGVAAVNISGMVLGFSNWGSAVLTLGGRLATLHSRLLLVAGVAAVIAALMPSQASAAEDSYKGLTNQINAYAEAAKLGGKAAIDFNESTVLSNKAKESLDIFKQKQTELTEQILEAKRKIADYNDILGKSSNPEFLKQLADFGLKGITIKLDELKNSAEENDAKIKALTDASANLNVQLKGTATAAGEASEQMRVLNGGVETTVRTMPNIGQAIEMAKVKVDLLRQGGESAVQTFERLRALKGSMSTGFVDNATPATDTEIKQLLKYGTEYKNVSNRIAVEGRKLKNMTSEQARGIVEFSDAMIDDLGNKTATALKQAEKKIDDYRTALKLLGVDSQEAAQRVSQLRQALEMQMAGINMSSLQMKPWQALQKGLEGFADSFADLLTKGTLTSKTFGQAFSQMALSISKDIVAMTIKAMILKPLMSNMFGAMGGGAGGFGGLSSLFGGGGGASSGWETSVTKFAKGGIFDSPTALAMPGGKSGVMGEAGTEAVMPLRKGPDGSLGVQVVGGGKDSSSQAPITIHFNVSTPDAASFHQSETQTAAMLSRVVGRGNRNA